MSSPAHDSLFADASLLPAAEPADSAEVLQCLSAARTLWLEGQGREAVRSLQRGAEAAERDGDDLRALTFARSAADLSAQLGASSPPSPLAQAASNSPATSTPIPASAPPAQTTPAPASSPMASSSPVASYRPVHLGREGAAPLSGEVRVSVKRSSLDESLFIVRPLADSAPVPAGAREARLVFASEGEVAVSGSTASVPLESGDSGTLRG